MGEIKVELPDPPPAPPAPPNNEALTSQLFDLTEKVGHLETQLAERPTTADLEVARRHSEEALSAAIAANERAEALASDLAALAEDLEDPEETVEEIELRRRSETPPAPSEPPKPLRRGLLGWL